MDKWTIQEVTFSPEDIIKTYAVIGVQLAFRQ